MMASSNDDSARQLLIRMDRSTYADMLAVKHAVEKEKGDTVRWPDVVKAMAECYLRSCS